MFYDKKKGSLLNYIQLPLNVITPYGTYLGVGYDGDIPNYILSNSRVKTFEVKNSSFSKLSKDYIIINNKPLLKMKDSKIGYGYNVTATEIRNAYITVANKRIPIETETITVSLANLILEKQLRNIGNVLEKFVFTKLGQPQFDALLIYFFYEGVDKIENDIIIEMINEEKWFDITDELQTNIRKTNGRVDEASAKLRMDISRIWSYVPGYS